MGEERGKIECPFCRSDNNIPINPKNPLVSIGYTPESHWREDADPEFKYNHSEWTIYIRNGRIHVQFRIFFCPICGRKLPEKKSVENKCGHHISGCCAKARNQPEISEKEWNEV